MRSRLLPVVLVFLALSLGCGDSSTGPDTTGVQALRFETFQRASLEFGQLDMSSGDANRGTVTNQIGLSSPSGAGSGLFYLPDPGNNRVLGYTSFPTTNGAAADFVVGQTGFGFNQSGTSIQRFRRPTACAVSDGKLFVTDYFNNRVLIWNSLPTGPDSADVVVGQPDFTTASSGLSSTKLGGPIDLAVAGGKLFVAEYGNHRVLIWNTIPTTNGAPADVVVGKPDFTSGGAGPTASITGNVSAVWSDGRRLVVTDEYNARVLIWNSVPTANGVPADIVLGASDFESEGCCRGGFDNAFDHPSGLASDGYSLFVADTSENRVMIYTPFPRKNNEAASRILGQGAFHRASRNDDNQDGVADAGPSDRTMYLPTGLSIVGRRLLVADQYNNRVLVFDSK